MEKPFRGRHAHQGAHFSAAARFAEDGDIGRVSPEGFDIVPDPFQGLYDVQHAHHAGVLVFFSEGGQVQEAQDIQAVIQAHHNHILFGQSHAGVPCGRSRIKAAAVDPQHHGFTGLGVRCPDIEHTGVLF